MRSSRLVMSIVTILSISGSALMAAAPAFAADRLETLVYEGFDYPNGTALDGPSGGSGWTTGWDWTYGSGGDLGVVSPGLTYPGLTTIGNTASWAFGGNNIAQGERSFDPALSGVVYFQVLTSGIANSNGSSGGGTPQIRFSSSGVQTAALGGNGVGTANVMGLLSGDLTTQLIASPTLLTSTNLLTIVRIDHERSETSLWTNPDLSTFDYLNPPAPDGSVSQTFAFDRLSILLRQGTVDEITIMRVVREPADPAQRPPDWMKQYARAEAEACDSEWSPSWAQWPNGGTGGFVCVQVLTWSNSRQTFVIQG